jgi:hypothetical protein
MADYTYGGDLDWTDKKSLGAFNNWRLCLFTRNIGPIHLHRKPWLETERNRKLACLSCRGALLSEDPRLDQVSEVCIHVHLDCFYLQIDSTDTNTNCFTNKA